MSYTFHRRQEVKNPFRAHKIQQNMLFEVSKRGSVLMMPRPLLGCQIKNEIQGFLLMYRLFLYYQWFFQNIEKGWRKIFEKDYFRDFLKMMKLKKKSSSASLFQYSIASTALSYSQQKIPIFTRLEGCSHLHTVQKNKYYK